jgi:cytosine/uracil/thiamine/allantoin permease
MGSNSHVSLLPVPLTNPESSLTHVRHGGGPLVTGHEKITSSYMNTAYSALTGLNVIIGLFSSMAVNMPDFGRFSKNRLAGEF